MISFESDYDNGTLPEILARLTETNNEKTSGYGFDPFCTSAKDKIKAAIEMGNADISFLVGGTQTNATVLDSITQGGEGVVTVTSGHIAVHESGAVEAFGHKVIALPTDDSKLKAEDLDAYLNGFYADETYPHMVQPGAVYVTMPTEFGMVYTKDELAKLYDTCRKHQLPLYIDGARLGYGLASEACDYDLPFLARHCDVFYIGGTKVGAMFGEAVVFSSMKAPKNFFTNVKRHGALLAKGRMLGIQFDALFTDGLYDRISRHAVRMAKRLQDVFARHHIPLAVNSPTNQQFVILSPKQHETLKARIAFEVWERKNGEEMVCRFVTSWATTEADIDGLDKALSAIGQSL